MDKNKKNHTLLLKRELFKFFCRTFTPLKKGKKEPLKTAMLYLFEKIFLL